MEHYYKLYVKPPSHSSLEGHDARRLSSIKAFFLVELTASRLLCTAHAPTPLSRGQGRRHGLYMCVCVCVWVCVGAQACVCMYRTSPKGWTLHAFFCFFPINISFSLFVIKQFMLGQSADFPVLSKGIYLLIVFTV